MRSLWLFALFALVACAAPRSSDIAEVPLPDGRYRLSGIMGTQAVEGSVEVRGEEIRLESNRGTCVTYVDYGANRGRVLRNRMVGLSCGGGGTQDGMRLSLQWDRSGKVRASGAVPITTMVRKRGECLRWSTDTTRRCLEYEWVTEPVTQWVSGPLTVLRQDEQGG